MAAIGRGRSLKNLRIRGKPAGALTPAAPRPALPAPASPGPWAAGAPWGAAGAGAPPPACPRVLTGAVCLFRAGRNDSGEENVPLDLTRGNAGGAGPGAGAVLGRSWPGGGGPGRTAHGTGGAAGARARGRLPGPIPLPGGVCSARPERSPGLGCGVCRGAGEPCAGLGAAGHPPGSRVPELGRRIPGRPEGVGGCYLGCGRMSEGRATTSCLPRPPEQQQDLLGPCCLPALCLPAAPGTGHR